MRLVLIPALLLALASGGAFAQTQDPQGKPGALSADTVQALERLAKMLGEKRAERATASAERVLELNDEMRELGWQFAGLASRMDVQQFEDPSVEKFDLQKELEELIKPLIQAIKNATKEPRELTDLERRIEELTQRQRTAEAAQRVAERTLAALPEGSSARDEVKREIDDRWGPTIESLRSEILILKARRDARRESRKSLVDTVSSQVQDFVQSSGLSLLLAGFAFAVTFLGLRFFFERLLRKRSRDRGFSRRLLEVVSQILVVVVAVLATLAVLYARNDWVLLAIATVFLLGVGWVLARALPQFFEQIRLMLNVGAVREGERIIYDGLPFRIDALRFYARLNNPELKGGVLRVPIKELVGKRSRRQDPDEPWFPCRPEEFVQLADGTFGKVLLQTPENVFVMAQGAPKSFPTAAFLAENPRNLSRGFTITVTFGIGYDHQAESTSSIPERMRQAVRTGLEKIVEPSQIKSVDVQFQEANTSSLDYLVLAEFDGAVAAQSFALQRSIQRMLVDVCTSNRWDIPFPQLTVHQE